MTIQPTASIQDVKDRVLETRAVQTDLADQWVWDSAALTDWDEWIRQFDTTSITPSQSLAKKIALATVAANNAKQAYDGALSNIKLTVTVAVSGLRAKAKLDPTLDDVVEELSAQGNTRPTILEEAENLVDAWEDYNAVWTPGSPFTLAGLITELAALPAKEKAFRQTRSTLRKAEKALTRHVAVVEDRCMAWYQAATGRFLAGTVEGDLIRARIPTTSAPSGAVAPATPTGLVLQALGSGRAFGDIPDTAGATGYRWYVKAPGSPDFVFKVETPTSEALLLSLTLGANEVRVTAVNTGGESLPSAPASLNVT